MTPFTLPAPRPARVAVIGIGNEMNGDDGAGVHVVRSIAGRMPATPGILLIDAGAAPESFTGPLRRFRPDLVIEIDAADHGGQPGSVAWLDWREADGLSASTHTLPPSVLAEFLVNDLGCQVRIVGIQPLALGPCTPLSPVLGEAVERLAATFCAWLSSRA